MKEKVGAFVGLSLVVGFIAGWGVFCWDAEARLHASTERRKDIIFVGPTPHCIGDAVECAESLHFNGDWTGTKLCRAAKCVTFEEVFDGKRNGPVEQR